MGGRADQERHRASPHQYPPYDKLRGNEAGLIVTASDLSELVNARTELAAARTTKPRVPAAEARNAMTDAPKA